MNNVVFEYLKAYKDKYPLGSLKEKILSKGYLESDYNEALALLNNPDIENSEVLKKSALPFSPKPIVFHSALERSGAKMPYKGFKWMMASSIVGFLFLFLILASIVASVIKIDLGFIQSILLNEYIPFIIGALFVLLPLVYLFGFFKVGKFSQISQIKISSILKIVIFILFISTIIISFFLEPNQINFIGSNSFGLINDNYSSSPSWPLFVFAFLFFFNLVLNYIFSIGLIKAQDEVKFSKITGIVNLILNILVSLAVLFVIYAIFFNPLVLVFFALDGIVTYFVFGTYTLIFVLSRFFEPLVLLNASKSYEN